MPIYREIIWYNFAQTFQIKVNKDSVFSLATIFCINFCYFSRKFLRIYSFFICFSFSLSFIGFDKIISEFYYFRIRSIDYFDCVDFLINSVVWVDEFYNRASFNFYSSSSMFMNTCFRSFKFSLFFISSNFSWISGFIKYFDKNWFYIIFILI